MARGSRLRRDLPVDIDVDAIWGIAESIGATQKQFRAAYSRALKRTAATLRKKAMADLKDGLAPRSINLVRRRLSCSVWIAVPASIIFVSGLVSTP